jgi:glycosyltransferase involved in cell wall biosynthesis
VGELITISIPTYRRPSLLLHALHSCFIQDYRPLEIDIGDNSPTNETRDLVATVAPPDGVSLRYWHNGDNMGVEGSMNRLFSEARGSRLVLLPDDDALLPGALGALDEAFDRSPDVILAYGMQRLIGESGEALPARETAAHNASQNRFAHGVGLRRDLLVCALQCQIPGSGFLVKADIAKRVGIRDRKVIGITDFDFNLRLAQAHRGSAFVLLDQEISQYRIWPDRMTQDEFGNHRKFYDIIAGLTGLSPDEERARDERLASFAWKVMTDDARAGRRRDALKVFFSSSYRYRWNAMRTAYALGLLASPRMTVAMRRAAARTALGSLLMRFAHSGTTA